MGNALVQNRKANPDRRIPVMLGWEVGNLFDYSVLR